MKQLSYKISAALFLLFVFTVSVSFAEEAKKQVSKNFNINRDTKITIVNKYGNVIINKWDKNVLELKVDIEAKGNNDSKTQKILDAIQIDIMDRISSGSLTIETEIGSINGNSSFSINYEVTMPNTNPMKLSNSFGSIYMGSYEGDLEVQVKYGQFQAEDLDRANINIEFSNSRCEIESLKSGKIDLRYSKLSVEEMGDIEISSQFSDLEIENAGALEMDIRYGKFEVENLKSLKGDLQFTGLEIEYLEESLHVDTRHGNGVNIEKVSRNFKEIDIEGQFSSIDISLEKGATSQLAFDLQFGNLKAYGDGINFTKVIKDHTTSEYEGYLGSKDATSSIKVDNRHGNIRLEIE